MIDYEEDWLASLVIKCDGSVAPKAIMYTMPAMVLTVLLLFIDEWMPGLREDLNMLDVNKSQLWSAVTSVAAMMLGFRTKQAWGRFWEGTGLLHQMRGEWFDTVSNCITFSIAAKPVKADMVMDFRHTIIRIMSLCHGSALEEIAGNKIELESIDCFGLNDDTLGHLMDCHVNYHFNKVEVMLHMLQSLITKALDDGVLKIPPPILSRVYQTISRGFVNLLNAKKIQDTKFPFPFAQLITLLLLILEVVTPLLMTSLIKSKVLCTLMTFIPLFGLFSLNFVSQELEDPFGDDSNDLPLEHFQTEMNNCLMMLLHPNSDIIAGIGPRCETNFHNLISQIRTSDLDEEEEPSTSDCLDRKTKRLSEFDISRPMHSFFSEDGISETSGRGQQSSFSTATSRVSEAATRKKSQVPAGGPASNRKSGPMHDSLTKKSEMSAAIIGNADKGDPTAKAVPMELDALSLSVAQEPLQQERSEPLDSARMQEPMSVLNSTTTQNLRSIEVVNDSAEAALSQISRIADLQPMLAKNMDALIVDLQEWTVNVHREVDSLNQNSAVLQNALQRFGDGLPELRAQTSSMAITPPNNNAVITSAVDRPFHNNTNNAPPNIMENCV